MQGRDGRYVQQCSGTTVTVVPNLTVPGFFSRACTRRQTRHACRVSTDKLVIVKKILISKKFVGKRDLFCGCRPALLYSCSRYNAKSALLCLVVVTPVAAIGRHSLCGAFF